MKVYILGNPNFEQDSFPVRLLPKLQATLPEFHFKHLDPTENLPQEKHLILIDTILGITEVKVLTDINKIQNSPQVSLHDFDLSFSLKLAKKLGHIDKVTILGVPEKGNEDVIIEQIKKEVIKANQLI